MDLILDIVSFVMLATGALIGISGAVGVLKFPEFYSRIHAASVTDTLSAGLILTGLMLQAGFTLVTVKMIFILLFLWYSSPVAGHALAQAAIHCGLKPQLSKEDSSSNT